MTRWPVGLTRSTECSFLAKAAWWFGRKAAPALAALLVCGSSPARAQDDDSGPVSEITPTDNVAGNPGGLPNDFFRSDPALGMRYRNFFRDTRSPFRDSGQPEIDAPLTASAEADVRYEGDFASFSTGLDINNPVPFTGSESIRSSMDFMFLRVDAGLVARHGFNLLRYGFDPQDADLKVGPLYFKLRALSGSLLMSDNVNLSEDDREKGAISIVRLAGSVVAQLTDNLRLSVGGTIYWLPFKGKVGLTSDSGFYDFNFGTIQDQPIAQISWDGRIGGWDVFLIDSFYANLNGELIGDYLYQQSLFEGSSFDEFDRAGRYSYGSSSRSRNVSISEAGETRDFDVTQYTNRIDAGAERLVPGPVRLRIRAYREDLWYNQGGRGRPSIREGASFFAGSERENMRFKPYVRYNVDRNDIEPEWDQLIVGGLRGPITDQLFMNIYAGKFFDGQTDQTETIAGLQLNHIAGPYTYESLFIGREINDVFATSEVVDRVTYNIHQVLGPKLFADAFASHETTKTVQENTQHREEFLTGIQLTLLPGPRTSARFSYIYNRITSDTSDFLFSGEDRFDDEQDGESTYTEHTVRLTLSYRFTDTFFGRLTYQYRDVNANIEENSFYENLVILTLTKTL